jgi:penicillin G amidase
MTLHTVLRLLRRTLPVLPPPMRRALTALVPTPVSLQERLAAFPTEGLPVERTLVIRWNEHQIPFIEAETDRDLAFGLGLVHQHLRAGQIALFKRFFYGRLSEMAGPVARDLDHAIRILDYGHAADEWEQRMPAETRAWVQAFCDGLNAYQDRTTRLPPEFALLGVKPEPFTFRDILVGSRFAGTDFTWLNYFPLLQRRGQPGFATLWNRTLETGESPTSSTRPDAPEGEFQDLLLGTPRSGSNSVAVSPRRSASGAAMIANDPHLGLSLPNLWILLGMRSPSYHAVGLSIVGLPMLGLGRNPDLAWGGTNLRAASSDLYDVSALPAESITTSETVIRCRFWRPVRRTIRRSPFGPIISDAKVVKCGGKGTIALRWVGHEPNDEMSSFIRCARARTPDEFRQAFAGYGVSGQNMLFCDRAGNIGHILAVTQPIRSAFPKDDLVLDAADPATHWQGFVDCTRLPMILNPKHGVLASANDRPMGTDVPIGFTFGSEDRIRRLYDLLSERQRLTFDDLSAIQTDTFAPDAAGLAQALAAELLSAGGEGAADFAARLATWDGDYSEASAGAVAFETFLHHMVLNLYGGQRPADLPDLYSQWSYLTTYLMPDLMALETEKRRTLLNRAAIEAAKDSQRYASWGDMHRLRLAHGLSRVPGVRGAFIIANLPVGGSRQTPMKMAHGLVNGRHAATFGSMARHISDMSDLDANWFVLLGGNDGWLGSTTFCDQLAPWRERRYIRMPLRPETVAHEFPIALVLPSAAGVPATQAAPAEETGEGEPAQQSAPTTGS